MAILNNSNAISTGGYDVNNSLRFRSSATAYLSRTPGTAGNRQKWTWSGWVKRGALSDTMLFHCQISSTDKVQCRIDSNNNIAFLVRIGNVSGTLITSRVLRDPSAWYHIVFACDTTQATATTQFKIYVNGVEETSFSSSAATTQNGNSAVNSTNSHQIGYDIPNASSAFDGYLAETYLIDGQVLTSSSFGETDATTGVWKPKAYSGTYGTNGFYLKFSDIATTSGSNAGLGKDFSGNTNYWTTNNISVTSGTTYDAMKDSPTNTSATVANFPVLNPLSNGGATISNANLTTTANGATHYITNCTFQVPTSGKYYWEITTTTLGSTARIATGLLPNGTALSGYPWGNSNTYGWYYGDSSNNIYWCSNTTQPFFISGAVNDVLQICYDADNGTVYAGKNNVFYNSSGSTTGSPSTLTNPTSTGVTATNAYFPATSVFTAGAFAINFGQRPFSYTPPTGFVALNTYNLPTPTILQGNKYMDATLYTGNSSTQTITNAGAFKPDLVWLKCRSTTGTWNNWIDSVRGTSKTIYSNTTNAEGTDNYLSSFNSNGFGLNTGDSGSNTSGNTYVGWQWQAGQGSTSSNTSGSITSTVSVNTTAGFSVVTYTGTGANATVGHGLGVAPKFTAVKCRNDGTIGWVNYHASLGNTQFLNLNSTNVAGTGSTVWNNTSPTSTTIALGTDSAVNGSTKTYVIYAWAEIAGFSKFTSYVGNGSTDGPFVFLGFRPKFVLMKNITTAGYAWQILDTSRNTYNVMNAQLFPNSSAAEDTTNVLVDYLSNGFKLRNADGAQNLSSNTYIVAAFAENPFKNANAR